MIDIDDTAADCTGRALGEGQTRVEDYSIRIDGAWARHDIMLTRADMSFYGVSSMDIVPPVGFYLDFNGKGREPRFVKIR